jgi:hypothetical protein
VVATDVVVDGTDPGFTEALFGGAAAIFPPVSELAAERRELQPVEAAFDAFELVLDTGVGPIGEVAAVRAGGKYSLGTSALGLARHSS